MAESVRLIVAGAGAFGREHIAALSRMPQVEIVGIADIRTDAAEEAAARYGVREWDADAVALVERLRPDGLVVATPASTHVAVTRSALAADVAVLVEKPVAPDAAEARSLMTSAA